MDYSTEDKAMRGEVVAKAVKDACRWLAGEGYSLTLEQARTVNMRLAHALSQLHADTPTESLDLLVCASVFQVVAEVLGILPPDNGIAWTLELVTVGGEAGRALLQSGGYPAPTPGEMKQITRALRVRAESLARMGMGMDPERAREDMRSTAARVVRVVLGEPPSRLNLN